MIELTGCNLAERHKELNIKITSAIENKADFNKIKYAEEKSDVDKLYKIGIASKYKNVEYIIETLKSGDAFYVTKALECDWLYDDEYSHIINPEYLHENVFPQMSLKMIRKLLKTLPIYLTDERAKDFYAYCIRMKHVKISMKFILFTPEAFKLEALEDKQLLNKLATSNEFLKYFVGSSFSLAKVYCNTSSHNKGLILYQLRYLYTVSDVKYLEMLRQVDCDWHYYTENISKRLGLRISKDIITKHKDEIYKYPTIYLNFLNKNMLTRHTTKADAKFYIKALIVQECPNSWEFWSKNVILKYAYLFENIPTNERLLFIKNIFTAQYPQAEFETRKEFYDLELYKLMTPEEREKWALKHVESGLKLLGSDKDFLWYRFVTFEKAFAPLKNYLQITTNVSTRKKIFDILIDSAKTDKELEIIFDYYYKRHVKAKRHNKECFVDEILSKHNVYKFSGKCWEVFNKILCSLEVYSVLDNYSCKSRYKDIALIYHIIHRKELPEALTMYIDSEINLYSFKVETNKLAEKDKNFVYEYLLQFYIDKINSFDNKTNNDEVKSELMKYIDFVFNLMSCYKKSKEDLLDIVDRYINIHFKDFFYGQFKTEFEPVIEQEKLKLMKYLKEDKDILISKLPLIKHEIMYKYVELNIFLKKIKTYFPNDLKTVFITLFQEIVAESRPGSRAIKEAIFGLIQLADSDLKKKIMTEYIPTDAKIDYSNIDEKILNIQKSICRFACCSRPPIPLSDIKQYIKGDYIHFCLPMFNSYLANLPKPACMEFVQSLLDAPLSVQKHALRMAFTCFNVHDLSKLISGVWKKTKNVSLRWVIYRYAINKIIDIDREDEQNILFEDLKSFTRSVHEEDDVALFKLLISERLPHRYIGEYIGIVWKVIDGLSEKPKFMQYRTNVIECMTRNVYDIEKEAVEKVINDRINRTLKQENHEDLELVVYSEWDLFHKYVTFFSDENDFNNKTAVVMFFIKESIRMWDKVDHDKYNIKEFVPTFINEFNRVSYSHDVCNYAKINKIFELILQEINGISRTEEIIEIIWFIRGSIITRNFIIYALQNFSQPDTNLYEAMDNIIATFVEGYTSLFKESLESGQCFVSLFDEIVTMFVNNLNQILNSIKYDSNIVCLRGTTRLLLCNKILEKEQFESYVFALKLLPSSSYRINPKDYSDVLNKLKSYKNNELKYYIYKKFS